MASKKQIPKKEIKDLKLTKTKQSVVDKITSNLDSKRLPWYRPFDLVTAIAPPKNHITNKEYQGINYLNLFISPHKDNRYMTFVQIKENGYKLKKGAKAEYVTKYRLYDRKTHQDYNPIVLNGMTKEEKETYLKDNVYMMSKDFAVFNGEDIEGIPKIKLKTRTQIWKEKSPQAKFILDNQEAKLNIKRSNKAYYSPAEDTIYLPEKKQFKTEQDFYGTAFHEVIHSTGHPKRLNRNMRGKFGSKDYAKEELVAEIGSMFLLPKLGVKNDPKQDENHISYLQSWNEGIKGNPNYLFESIKDASKATDYIMTYGKSQNVKKYMQDKIKKEGK